MNIIEADQVSVEFPIYGTTSRSLRHALVLDVVGRAVWRQAQHVGGSISDDGSGTILIKALDDISFSIKEGDRVGLIGHNGSGKTTLLRLLAGIYEPTGGKIEVRGNVMPLFNLMEGVAPEATGDRATAPARGPSRTQTDRNRRDDARDLGVL